jgi:hypothetical protein
MRIYLDNGHIMCAYPNESSADIYGALATDVRLYGGNKITALAINALNGAVTFIENPDRSLPRGQGLRIRPEFDRSSDLIGGGINAIQLIVSRPRDPD